MLIAEFAPAIAATLSPLLKLKIIAALAGSWNPVLIVTVGALPNAIKAGLAPLVIRILRDVNALLVAVVLAVNPIVWHLAAFVAVVAPSMRNGV